MFERGFWRWATQCLMEELAPCERSDLSGEKNLPGGRSLGEREGGSAQRQEEKERKKERREKIQEERKGKKQSSNSDTTSRAQNETRPRSYYNPSLRG